MIGVEPLDSGEQLEGRDIVAKMEIYLTFEVFFDAKILFAR
ncbi:hypothetical protein [Nostoc sp.]